MPPKRKTFGQQQSVRNMAGSSKNSDNWNENSKGCSYQDFVFCGAQEFSGERGALEYLMWAFKMDMVVELSECTEKQSGEYITRMLTGRALKWWDTLCTESGQTSAKRIVWSDLKSLMEDEFYPSSEKQMMEQELMDLRMLGNDYAAYTRRFQDLCILVPHMGAPESRQIDLFIRGLDPRLQGVARTAYPLTMQNVLDRVEPLASDILSQAPPKSDDKDRNRSGYFGRKSRTNKHTKSGKTYGGSYPECLVCRLHHPVTIPCSTCHLCNRLGHIAKDCHEEIRLETPVRVQDPTVNKRACYECGSQDHRWKACLKPGRASGQGQRSDSDHYQGWTYAISTDGEQHEIPILRRSDEYADDGSTK